MRRVQAYVEIVKVPEGEAPYWVRKEWVGLKLPIEPEHYDGRGFNPLNSSGAGIISREIGEYLGWRIGKKDSIRILSERNSEAADWFKRNDSLEGIFLFNSDEAILVE